MQPLHENDPIPIGDAYALERWYRNGRDPWRETRRPTTRKCSSVQFRPRPPVITVVWKTREELVARLIVGALLVALSLLLAVNA